MLFGGNKKNMGVIKNDSPPGLPITALQYRRSETHESLTLCLQLIYILEPIFFLLRGSLRFFERSGS